jgi:hypothetical protein
VDRRRAALYALVGFALATAVSIVISGARPADGQGIAPLLVQAVGYVCALVAGLELLAPAPHPVGADRKLGGALLAALGVLVLLDVVAFADDGGANIGAGFLRLVCLVVIVAVAARLLTTSLASSRRRP